MILLGCRWLLVDEPWMLDEIANVERLEMTFDELFSADINSTLPGYLKQIYRFFGLWVTIIGLFITFFSTPNLNHSSSIRLRLLLCIGVMILIGATFFSLVFRALSKYLRLSFINRSKFLKDFLLFFL